jgi:hypothetical protein
MHSVSRPSLTARANRGCGVVSGWHRGRSSLSGPTQNMPRPYFPTSGTPHLHSELRPSGRCLITSSARLRTAAPPKASHQACLQVLRMHAIPGPIVPRGPLVPHHHPRSAPVPHPQLSRSASVRHANGVTPILINTARWATEVDPYPWRMRVVSQLSPARRPAHITHHTCGDSTRPVLTSVSLSLASWHAGGNWRGLVRRQWLRVADGGAGFSSLLAAGRTGLVTALMAGDLTKRNGLRAIPAASPRNRSAGGTCRVVRRDRTGKALANWALLPRPDEPAAESGCGLRAWAENKLLPRLKLSGSFYQSPPAPLCPRSGLDNFRA